MRSVPNAEVTKKHRRASPVADEAYFQETLGVVERHFTAEWLGSGGAHPLQALWARSDFLSSIELHTLGDALAVMEKIDRRWTVRQVKLAKSDNASTHRGALFEIVGLALFGRGPQTLVPAPDSQPGYDAIVAASETKTAHLSLKSYGTSEHERRFSENAANFRAVVHERATRRRLSMHVVAVASTYPSPDDWRDLFGAIDTMLAPIPQEPAAGVVGAWTFFARALVVEGENLDPDHCSDHTVLIARIHENEHTNLWSKLEEAYRNLGKHETRDHPDRANVVLVKLPVGAPAAHCPKWAEDFFARHPEMDIGAVAFVQPSVVRDLSEDKTALIVFTALVVNATHAKWLPGDLRMEIPVGVPSREPSRDVMVVGERSVDVGDSYLFQRGDIYMQAARGEKGGWSSHAGSHVPGVRVHSVLELQPRQKVVISSRIHAMSEELLIL